MIEVYSWATPNGHKAHIMLEECGLPHRVIPVDIGRGAQFEADFLAISPNNKIPAIVDPDGPDGQPISLMESGAILLYLAGKTGRFLPSGVADKYQVLQWLMFQMGSVGPMLGQAHHFRIYAPEKIAYTIDRYTNEAKRLYAVINKRLGQSPYIGGKDYSIADIAIWPWLRSWKNQGVEMTDYPHLKGWFDEIEKAPTGCRYGRSTARADGREVARDAVSVETVPAALSPCPHSLRGGQARLTGDQSWRPSAPKLTSNRRRTERPVVHGCERASANCNVTRPGIR